MITLARKEARLLIPLVIASMIMLFLGAQTILAAPPQQGPPPYLLVGRVYVNGVLAPEGTTVSAIISGTQVATAATGAQGTYILSFPESVISTDEVRISLRVGTNEGSIYVVAQPGALLLVDLHSFEEGLGTRRGNKDDTPSAEVRLILEANIEAEVGDEISIDFQDFGLPDSIDPKYITISDGEDSGHPSDVFVDGSDLILYFDDLNTDNIAGNSLNQENVTTIRISSGAGIKNPIRAGAYPLPVSTATTRDTNNYVVVTRKLNLDRDEGTRGESLKVTGKGFVDSTAIILLTCPFRVTVDRTVTCPYGDQERVLGSTNVEYGEFIFTTTIGDEFYGYISRTADSGEILSPAGPNHLRAIDGAGGEADADPFFLKPRIETASSETSPGTSLTIMLSDWKHRDQITSVAIGGGPNLAPIEPSAIHTDDNGEAEFDVLVPWGTRFGTLPLKVESETITTETHLVVEPFPLVLSPASAVSNQEVVIEGSGFNPESHSAEQNRICGSSRDICSVKVSGKDLLGFDLSEAVVSSSGDVLVMGKLPLGLRSGVNEVTITDWSGRIGKGELFVPSPELTINPDVSSRGSEVVAKGTGFPARDAVKLNYGRKGEDSDRVVAIGTTGFDGSFELSFRIPNDAIIGADHMAMASSLAGEQGIEASAPHSIPRATIALSSSQVSAGRRVTVHGAGFSAFVPVSDLTISGLSVLPSPRPSTDAEGTFDTEILVPQVPLGTQKISVTVDGYTASDFINVIVAPPERVIVQVFQDAIESENLVRVWRLNRATQNWSFYDPLQEYEAFNTLDTVEVGDIVAVQVLRIQEFMGETLHPGWNYVRIK